MLYQLPKSIKTREEAIKKSITLCTCYQKSFSGVKWTDETGSECSLSWGEIFSEVHK